MRLSNGHVASDSVNWAASSFSHGEVSRNENRCLNADLWGTDEAAALEHVLHSLTSLGLAYILEFKSAVLHGALQLDDGFIQVVAIRGDTYEDCRLHYDKCIPHLGADPVLVIALSPYHYVPMPEEFLRLDETAGERGLAFLDYTTLVTNCRNAADSNTLKGLLHDFLPKHRRII